MQASHPQHQPTFEETQAAPPKTPAQEKLDEALAETRVTAGSQDEATLNRSAGYPFKKLKQATDELNNEREAWEKSVRLVEESAHLRGLSPAEQQALKNAFASALSKSPEEDEALSHPEAQAKNPGKMAADEYLDKTTTLIARKLAALINRERTVKDALEFGDMAREKHVMAKHMMALVEENRTLREDVEMLQRELNRFVPAALGLYHKRND